MPSENQSMFITYYGKQRLTCKKLSKTNKLQVPVKEEPFEILIQTILVFIKKTIHRITVKTNHMKEEKTSFTCILFKNMPVNDGAGLQKISILIVSKIIHFRAKL